MGIRGRQSTVRSSRQPVKLPLSAPPSGEELRALKAEWASRQEYSDNGTRSVLDSWLEWAAALPDLRDMKFVSASVTVFDWGDFRLVFLPGEPFVRIALDLREALDDRNLLVAGYSGGVPGYIPYPPEEYAFGGYEVEESHRGYKLPAAFSPEAGQSLVNAALSAVGYLGTIRE